MLVSTKGRYALRVMLELALSKDGEYKRLDSIAKSQNISEKYLESIVSILVKANIVEGMRGRGGGYRLTRKPEKFCGLPRARLRPSPASTASRINASGRRNASPYPCGRSSTTLSAATSTASLLPTSSTPRRSATTKSESNLSRLVRPKRPRGSIF